jgi:hypothetical protein
MPLIQNIESNEVEISVYCNECGTGLCGYTTVKGHKIYIDPCPNCLNERQELGYNQGFENARRIIELKTGE